MKLNQKINNYTILAECGKGAFGTVYLAQRDDGKYVAFKVVSLLGNAGDRELQAITSYQSCPYSKFLLQIFDLVVDNDKDYFYYTMELADNILGINSNEYKPCTLEAILHHENRLNVAQTREIVYHLLDGLTVLHQNNFVHRDIKPGNIVWVNGISKLADVGLLANDQSMTVRAGSDGFTPSVNSPIALNSKAVDLYALTRVIFCCLSGKMARHYLDWELPDEVKYTGRDLLKIMLLQDKELSLMDVKEFKNLLYTYDDLHNFAMEEAISTKCCMSHHHIIGSMVKELDHKLSKFKSYNEKYSINENDIDDKMLCKSIVSADEFSFSNLSSLANVASAQSWIDKQISTTNNLQSLANKIIPSNTNLLKTKHIFNFTNIVKDILSIKKI